MSGQGHNPLLLSKFYLDAMDAEKDATDAERDAMDAEKDATDAVKEAMDAEKDANGIRN